MYMNLYKSLIRPIIEYGNIIWGPHYILDQQSIEKFREEQPDYLLACMTPYSDRLAILRLPTLQYHCL